MRIGFKTELNPNNRQRSSFARHAGIARHAWNWGLGITLGILEHNKTNPDNKIKFPTGIDLHKWLVALVKPENQWYYESSKSAPQNALRNLALAWRRCFKKISKQPRFKKKGRDDSFTLDGSIKLEPFRVKLPRIGWVRTFERLPHNIKPKSVTVSRKADRWFVSLSFETSPDLTPKTVDVVGVDLGVKSLATLSTSEVFEGAKSYRKLESKLSRLQWLNRRKLMGSANWKKAQLKIAKLHQKIANIRKDTLHKLTTYLAKNHSRIVIENLNVKGLMANRKLAKAICDMGFYEFRRQLEYKCELYGSELIVVSRWEPSTKRCSNCGHLKEMMPLQARVYHCQKCGFQCDRDLNAARNLAALAGSLPVSAYGSDSADTSEMK
ncbi:RNA-guided endonuclease InsQ/TnpB family protein [Capilliphycus salinus ALCB114379]|uniref:RNA-guided endonuclease InsQ/TnpB family protein n=1 Tax=Capilliphycus salinus TaxID=2768948 RepID=UPI0039A55B55